MWWKLICVGVLTAALIYVVFFMPVATTVVKLNMPSGTTVATAQHINDIGLIVSWTVTALFVVAVFATPIWLAWRILRGRRSAERPTE